jgi:hypothetical protein
MKSIKKYSLLFMAIVLLTWNVTGQETEDKRPSRERWSLAATHGTVSEINKETREITLMDSQGGLVTITAGEAVERFDEIEVGDMINFEYWTYMMAEFREPTAQEIEEPLVVLTEAGKAPEGVAPGAVVGAVVKAVVTIEVLNRPNMLATVQGPRGNYLTIQMEDPKLMEELRIGEVVILTYAEAIAVSLEKVSAPKK